MPLLPFGSAPYNPTTDTIHVLKAGDTMSGNLVFTNSQKIIGGTSTTADLSLQTTSGVGATGADMHFLVGNNGATEALTILNSGNVGIGATNPSQPLHIGLTSGEKGILVSNSDATDAGSFVSISNTASGKSFTLEMTSNSFFGTVYNNTGLFTTIGADMAFITDANVASGGTNIIKFATGGSNAANVAMTINASQNVGIGTTAPGNKLELASSTSSTGGIGFGTDVNLYRSAANTLKTDDEVIIGINGGKDTLSLSNTTADVGITIGADTNLYRSAADTLKTDDALIVVGTLGVTGIITASATGRTAVTIADSGAQSSGLTIGGDTNLYRFSSNVLQSDDVIVATAGASSGYAALSGYHASDTTKILVGGSVGAEEYRFRISLAGITEWGAGVAGVFDTNLYRSAANILATDDDLSLKTAGKGLQIKEGSNARMGVSTLVAGTVTVSNTSVTANTRIFLTVQSLGTVAVATPIAVTARTAGTSFTITSAGITDTSVVGWLLIEPS